ncbi:subtilisin-like protein [Auricularia subglabra TFB-10046 SS5]|uniref:Subtilisin-like protein n=1 Tax=Auricularia subglabra (strain TFB-10046 / SS5) TaxID=717982 RepID=J0DDN5_AURST|nr:subtilisin-like protein [Auricularia subglabra TFB-10046 SS5]
MRSLAAVVGTLLSAGGVLGASTTRARGLLDLHANNGTVPGGFIVELSSSSTKRAADTHADFLSELDKRAAGKFTTRKKYDSPLFNGIAIRLHTPEDLISLASIPNVVAVRPIQIFQVPKTVDRRIVTSTSDADIPVGQSVHYMTGVDKLHAQGIAGKGVKVAVVDSGVDYMHPSLGGGFGPGFKVAGGYDLVGDEYTGFDNLEPDDDPRDTCIGHGTHVAGIVGMDPGNAYNVSGVAYDATILAYRVLSCWGLGSDDVYVDALLRAHADGADIITVSLGDGNGWASTSVAVVASRIAEQGRVVTISAGNDGTSGSMFFASPATGENVISVASVQNLRQHNAALRTSVEHAPIPYAVASFAGHQGMPLSVDETPIPLTAISTDPDAGDSACEPLNVDLQQQVVIVRSATKCDSDTQVSNLVDANANIILFYDQDPAYRAAYGLVVQLPVRADADFLISELAKGTPIRVTFPQDNSGVDVPDDNGGLVSPFSSYGPSNEVLFKPSVAAPGGNILSTWLIDDGSWAVDSGTSMSTPYTAGAAALILQMKGKNAAKNVRSILQTTADSIPASKDKGALPQTLAQAGAGLINVFNALNAHTEVSPAELLLNDTAHWKGSHKITIKNTGKAKQSYTISHVPAMTVISLASSKINFLADPDIKQVSAPARVKLSQSSMTLSAGQSAMFTATISAPAGVDPKLLPVVSGSIVIDGSQGDALRVSYMGIAGSLRDAQTISTSNDMLVPESGGLPAVIPVGRNESGAQRGSRNYTLTTLPRFAFTMAQGSRHVKLDLLDAAADVHSTIPDPLDSAPQTKRGFTWSSWLPESASHKSLNAAGAAAIATLGPLAEWRDLPRGGAFQRGSNFIYMEFPSQFANGTKVPFGQYKLLLRALRITGNPSKAADWDVYVSQQVGILDG